MGVFLKWFHRKKNRDPCLPVRFTIIRFSRGKGINSQSLKDVIARKGLVNIGPKISLLIFSPNWTILRIFCLQFFKL